MTMVGRNIHDLVRKVGPERAKATHLAMRETLHAIESFVADEGIAASLSHPGILTVANNPEQDVRIQQDMEAAMRLGLDDFRFLTGEACQALVASPRVRCGHWEDDALLVDPAGLALGLKQSALRRGVRLFERSPAVWLDESGAQVRVTTPQGRVYADRGLVATNAYAAHLAPLRRFLFTVYAYIVVTEPLTAEQWRRVGWGPRMGIEDKRIMPHFHRPTPDGRILWGGRDAPITPWGPDARRDQAPHIFRRLEETFRWTFPQFSDVRIAMGWGGPVCGTVRAFATVGPLGRRGRWFYALGYAGHGVGPSHLVARMARDRLLGRTSELLELPMSTERPIALPPEPFKGWMLEGVQTFLQRADDQGSDQGRLTRWALRFLQ